MKLSNTTLTYMKNFATINPSIYIRKGSVLATKSTSGNILAEAMIEEEFPVSFGMYGLGEFLNTIKLFSEPILDFSTADDNYMVIYEQDDPTYQVRYTFSDPRKIVYPKKRPLIDKTDISFVIDVDTLASIQKAASVMRLGEMVLTPGDPGKINIVVTNIKNTSANKFSLVLDCERDNDVDFYLIINMDTLKMFPSRYQVSFVGNSLVSFEAMDDDNSYNVDYYIGLNIQSKYGI